MRNLLRFIAILVAAVWMTSSAVAGQQTLKPEGVIGEDNRKPMDSWDEPWNAVGKVHAPKAGSVYNCTGTLIDPKVVVTAAHCVYDHLSEKLAKPSAVHFVAGYRKEKYIAHSVAECIKIAPDFKFSRKASLEQAKLDYAFLVLKKPMNIPVVRIYQNDWIAEGDRLVHAGYCCDRFYLLSVHDGCRAKYKEGNAYFTDCDTAEGASGGPVFVKQNDVHYIAAVMSTAHTAKKNGESFNFGNYPAPAGIMMGQ